MKFSLSSWLKNILLILGLVVFILLINLWWIIPVSQAFVVQAINQAGTFLPSTVTEVETWAWTHARSSFLNIFWLNTGWGWPYNYYYPYAQYYNNPILQVVVFLPLIIAFSSLLFLKKNKPWRPLILFSAVVVLVMFFLGKGLHQPWREVNFWLYQHIPLFWLFREPFGKLLFIIMPLLALLFAFGASNLVDLISRKKRVLQTIFSAVVVLIVLTTVFPLVTGQVILKKQHGQLPGWLVEVPDYWFKMSGYINDQKGDGRILLLPNHDFYMLPYDWGYYGIAIGPELIHSRPLVKLISDEGYIKPSAGYLFLKSQLQQSIDNEDEDKFLQLTKILNIEYILQRNDIDYDLPSRKMFSPEKIRDFLSQVEGVKLERSFGQLDFYKLSGQEDKLVYLTNSYTAVTNEDDWYQSSFTGSNVFLSNCQLPSTSEVSLEKFNYHWQRVNPSRLEVVVDQLTQPAVLVFNESFNPNWVLYIDGVRLSEVKHCLANNYANAWLLDPSEQDLNISLEYQPQKYFWCYFPLSLIVLLGGVVYLLVIKLRKK